MKVLIFILFGINICNAQHKIFYSDKLYNTIDIIIVSRISNADLVINNVDVTTYTIKNAWLTVPTQSESDYTVRIVNNSNGNRKAIRVYFNQSGYTYINHKYISIYKLLVE